MSLLSRTAIVVILAALPLSALGHDTWLAPDRYHRQRPGAVRLSLTSGMEFPKLDHAIKRDRVAVARARDASGGAVNIVDSVDAEHALMFRSDLRRGVTAFWVVLHPRPSQLKAEQVREYVEHLGISDPETVIADWDKKRAATLPYRYVKYAKTFVRAGETNQTRGGSWRDATGMRLELVPETDPTRVTAGGTLRFLLLDEGKPRARYPVSVIHNSTTRALRTDDEGRVTIDVPTAGPYLVRATTLVPSAVQDVEWDVHFTTVSFEAHANRRIR